MIVYVEYYVEKYLCNYNNLSQSFQASMNKNGKLFQKRRKKSKKMLT